MSVLQKLTEGIVERSLQREGAALLDKWEATGLLEGIDGDNQKAGMARLLENQAAQLLKEASSMAAGDVEGFASVAFPIVRRVFGGLLANDLVSVQPMSLPSGLIFFLDFTYQDGRMGQTEDKSVYGGGVVAAEITGGVTDITEAGGGFYNMANAYSHATASATANMDLIVIDSVTNSSLTEANKKSLRFDPDLLDDLETNTSKKVAVVGVAIGDLDRFNRDHATAVSLLNAKYGDGDTTQDDDHNATLVRRLSRVEKLDSSGNVDLANGTEYLVLTMVGASLANFNDDDTIGLVYPKSDAFQAGDGLGSVVGTSNWPLEEPSPGTGNDTGLSSGKNTIAEIDIKVDSIAVTAQTKKLKAKWTPELGQDLNAYHNLDAEVELTQILSEQIALEIDREIVNDLVDGATAGTYYWSRSPGLFVNRLTGAELGATAASPDFTGTVSEWYETLIETINDVSAQIHRKTLRGGANFLVTSPEVANILEFTAGFRASVTHDADKGTVGAVNVGSVSRKFEVYVDPYFPRNVILVGRKGGSFLESGFVYAPYVPLQVTPTIFGTEDFVPRKGVMTRYAKKMVRPDMYGLVICRGLLGESGAS